MKKWLKILAVIICVIPVYSFSNATEYGRTWQQLSDSERHGLKVQFQSRQNTTELFLFPNSDFNTGQTLEMMKRIDRLPPSLLSRVAAKGIKVKLFNGSLTANTTARHLKGRVPRGYQDKSKTWDVVPGLGGGPNVLVKIGASAKGSGHGSVNLELHELAHSIDNLVFNKIRHNDSFLALWSQEAAVMFPEKKYFINYPEEYFAECFAFYYYNDESRELLKKGAPKTFAYIKQLK
ncbi:anthrax toxin lethal factor-related metalloendopeptidase [Bacillus sp. M6-12]|uniref:anthrax toxin lethal factor-related metalloendopeptidase n=1 Tax=Bacillus sp. M6-12 TaxID=2054166 RepID=UPI00115908DA|nr:toxin [Bacillus sp. M6-12]